MLTQRANSPWSPYHKRVSKHPSVTSARERGAGPTRRIGVHNQRRSRAVAVAGTVGLTSNGVASNTALNGSVNASSTLVDPQLLSVLQKVAAGGLQPETAARHLRELGAGYQQVMDFAQVDTWRAARTGFPEVIWGPGKSPEQLVAIMTRLAETEALVVATRITPEAYAQVHQLLPGAHYSAKARILSLKTPGKRKQERLPGTVAVLSAGTADEGVAEECRLIADFMGCYTFRLPDVSIDGLHKILHNLPAVRAADVIVVVSGTDGALASVVAGLVETPVIAVPTSVGYGAALNGATPLLSALVSSSPGVSVVNIDNGFGGAMVAARILKTAAKLRRIGMGTQ